MATITTHPKKRIEIIIEAPLLRRLTECLTAHQVTGYTVLPVIGGGGREGSWSAAGVVSEASHMAFVICIADAARVPDLLEAVYALVSRQIGIVTVSDVEVVRAERF